MRNLDRSLLDPFNMPVMATWSRIEEVANVAVRDEMSASRRERW
jgi:hypothetical protein